jgi:hypothetical protein
MKTTVMRAAPPAALALALLLALAGTARAGSQTYTLVADFDLGTLTGVNHTVPNNNQLQLEVTGSSFPVLWIANAGEDTLSKVDSTQQSSSPGREIARYRTWFDAGTYDHGAWTGAAPSRTAVDASGNAYVLDRWFGGYPTLFKILNNTFIDRNGDGVLQTSSDLNANGRIELNEMLPLVDTNHNGVIDPGEIQDERIVWVRRVPDGTYNNGATRVDGIGRALCIGTDGNLWVGLYNSREYYKVSATDGHTIAGPVTTAHPNYGCLIDQNGVLWGANWGDSALTRIANTASDSGPYTVTNLDAPRAVYGLALRRDRDVTHVIMGGSCESYWEFDDASKVFSHPAAVNYCTYAVGTDNSGNILISKQNGGVAKFDVNGNVLWDKSSQVGGSDSRGVIADSNNDIWQVHRGTNNMAKYRGSDGNFLGVLGIGAEPYTYSDASGTAALSITTKTGNWDMVKDSATPDTRWGTIRWNATVPSGASIKVEARAANTTPQSGSFLTVASGVPFRLSGRYLEVRATLNANPQNQSPVLADLTIQNSFCDVNGDGQVDRNDIGLITAARNLRANAFDSRDPDGDGIITVNDARLCSTRCSKLNCVP